MRKILYFTGTGNSLAIGKYINDKITQTELLPLLKIDEKDMKWKDIEQLIIVYPVYVNDIPAAVKEKLISLKIPKDLPTIFIATHGGNHGVADASAYDFTIATGILMTGYFQIEMINNTPKGLAPKFLMRLDWEKQFSGTKLTKMFERNEREFDNITHSILKDESGELESAKNKHKSIYYKSLKFITKLAGDKPPKLEFIRDETCTGCGICEKVCLTNRIKLVNNRPSWTKDECYYCYACFNFCPEQAISVKHYTKKQGRYHYQGITKEDIACQK